MKNIIRIIEAMAKLIFAISLLMIIMAVLKSLK